MTTPSFARALLLPLDQREQSLLVEALRLLRDNHGGSDASSSSRSEVEQLLHRIERLHAKEPITIGVHGGQVQFVANNPVPIRVCDYDGSAADLKQSDDDGHPCRMWIEPPALG